MFVILPMINILLSGKGGNLDFSMQDIFKFQFPLQDILAKFLPGTINNQEIYIGMPNIYITLIGFLLAQFYFLRKNIPIREKIASLIFIAFLLINFENKFLNLIWHGFKIPAGYPYRYAFVFCFFLIMLAAKGLNNASKEESKRWIIIVIIDAVIIYLLKNAQIQCLTEEAYMASYIFLAIYRNKFFIKINNKKDNFCSCYNNCNGSRNFLQFYYSI